MMLEPNVISADVGGRYDPFRSPVPSSDPIG
jgi:hypothetical protein